MGEAIISKRISSSGEEPELRTEIITTSVNWKVPKNIKNNTIDVRIFGGGGSSSSDYSAGGGGWMNNGVFSFSPGQSISVDIGTSGAPTTFGNYLTANSAIGKDGGSGGDGGIGYQFGGGGGGGNGGLWGGGGGGSRKGGDGGLYGGGGGGCSTLGNGGNGGTYGGGGGAGSYYSLIAGSYSRGYPATGGSYGGMGGNVGSDIVFTAPDMNIYKGNPGTNTIGKRLEFEGNGIAGFITNGGYGTYRMWIGGGSGGGGYGGMGGNGSIYGRNSDESWSGWLTAGGGGGGGYGSNGGHGYTIYRVDIPQSASGGGGGYGGDGASDIGGGGGYGKEAKGGKGIGGGGGYGGAGGNDRGGGGGYGNGAQHNRSAGIAGGGCGNGIYRFAGPGACIIQYYI